MKTVTIAFDIDGTVRDNTNATTPVPNERIRTLLVTLSSFKNTKIILWSPGKHVNGTIPCPFRTKKWRWVYC